MGSFQYESVVCGRAAVCQCKTGDRDQNAERLALDQGGYDTDLVTVAAPQPTVCCLAAPAMSSGRSRTSSDVSPGGLSCPPGGRRSACRRLPVGTFL